MSPRKQIIPHQSGATDPDVTVVIERAPDRREAAAALHAQARQTHRQASALVKASNALLDSAVAITKETLERRRIPFAEPVAARFLTDERGSTGIEITIRLEDPMRAAATRQALIERFGGEGDCDHLIVR